MQNESQNRDLHNHPSYPFLFCESFQQSLFPLLKFSDSSFKNLHSSLWCSDIDISDYSFMLVSIDDYIYLWIFLKIVHLSSGMQLTLVFIIDSSDTRVKCISDIYVTMMRYIGTLLHDLHSDCFQYFSACITCSIQNACLYVRTIVGTPHCTCNTHHQPYCVKNTIFP